MEIEKLIARLKCPAIQSCPIDGIQPSCNACQIRYGVYRTYMVPNSDMIEIYLEGKAGA